MHGPMNVKKSRKYIYIILMNKISKTFIWKNEKLTLILILGRYFTNLR